MVFVGFLDHWDVMIACRMVTFPCTMTIFIMFALGLVSQLVFPTVLTQTCIICSDSPAVPGRCRTLSPPGQCHAIGLKYNRNWFTRLLRNTVRVHTALSSLSNVYICPNFRHAHMLAESSKWTPKAEAAKKNRFSVYSQGGRSLAWL